MSQEAPGLEGLGNEEEGCEGGAWQRREDRRPVASDELGRRPDATAGRGERRCLGSMTRTFRVPEHPWRGYGGLHEGMEGSEADPCAKGTKERGRGGVRPASSALSLTT